MPSISMKPLVPSSPGPPKDPKSFWAPCPAIREPCTTRTIIGAASLTLEAFILTPSVAFSGHITLVRQRRRRLTTLYTLDPRFTLLPFHWSLCARAVSGRSLGHGLSLAENSARWQRTPSRPRWGCNATSPPSHPLITSRPYGPSLLYPGAATSSHVHHRL